MNDSILTDYGDFQIWMKGKLLHRIDGPAYTNIAGRKEWWVNGQLHREDGPAVELNNGHKLWFYYGKGVECSTQQQFEKLIKLKAFW